MNKNLADTITYKGVLLSRVPEMQQEIESLRKQLEEAQVTITTLSDSDAIRGLKAGIEDLKAGRVVALSCVRGGCERDELRSQLATATQRIAELEQDRERLDWLEVKAETGSVHIQICPRKDPHEHVWKLITQRGDDISVRESIDAARGVQAGEKADT